MHCTVKTAKVLTWQLQRAYIYQDTVHGDVNATVKKTSKLGDGNI